MPVKIHKSHTVVHTAAIDVKTLRLGKKQITLSVFRQIEEETIFSCVGLRGDPWGRVNYTWGNQIDREIYGHVVWQDGEQIKRSPAPDLNLDMCARQIIRFLPGDDENYVNDCWHKFCRQEKLSYPIDLGSIRNLLPALAQERNDANLTKLAAVYSSLSSQIEILSQLDQLFIAV